MDYSIQGVQEYSGFLAFVILFIASRLLVRSAVKFLDDEAKIKLVDASARYNWTYILVAVAIGLFFVDFRLGVVALLAYFVFAVTLNYKWAVRNDMPAKYRNRVVLGHCLFLLGLAAIGAQLLQHRLA